MNTTTATKIIDEKTAIRRAELEELYEVRLNQDGPGYRLVAWTDLHRASLYSTYATREDADDARLRLIERGVSELRQLLESAHL